MEDSGPLARSQQPAKLPRATQATAAYVNRITGGTEGSRGDHRATITEIVHTAIP
jgi:hypothetical protein